MKIVTEYWAKPIPIRAFDWVAHFDDPEGPTGYGPTEQAAIDDLVLNHPLPRKTTKPGATS
jgi:hypothetical protein